MIAGVWVSPSQISTTTDGLTSTSRTGERIAFIAIITMGHLQTSRSRPTWRWAGGPPERRGAISMATAGLTYLSPAIFNLIANILQLQSRMAHATASACFAALPLPADHAG